jgi:hypothetical protein
MFVLAALVLALAGPPPAYVDTGSVHVPLAISSWCWGARCGAPIAASRHIAYVSRGSTVHVELGFAPTEVRLAIGGAHVLATFHHGDVSWRATRSGGITLTATGVRGSVTYVGRLAFR